MDFGSSADRRRERFYGVCDLDDTATLAAHIHELRVSERFVGNHPRPVNPALASDAMELDFDFLDLGVHEALVWRLVYI